MRKLIMLSLVSCLFSCSEQRTEKEYIVTYNDGSKDTVIGCDAHIAGANDKYYYFSDKNRNRAAIIPVNKIKSVKVKYDNIR